MAVLVAIRLIPRVDEHFILDGERFKSVHGHGDGVGVGLHLKRSVLDEDLRLPEDEVIFFITWDQFKQLNEALNLSDKETLKLRNGKGWNTGPRPYGKRGLKLHEIL